MTAKPAFGGSHLTILSRQEKPAPAALPLAPEPAAPRITPAHVARVNELAAEEPARRTRTRRKQVMPLDVTRPVFNREEAAQYLGVGRSTLLAIAQAGRDRFGKVLGHTRTGARLAFLKEDLDRYLRNEEPRAGATVGWKVNQKRVEARHRTIKGK